jgi:monoamine oxidase
MDMIAQAFVRVVGDLITYNAKVVSMPQDETVVTVRYETTRDGGDPVDVTADWCVCAIPFAIPGQMEHNLPSDKVNLMDRMYDEGSEIRPRIHQPLLGGGCAYLWWDFRYRSADRADQLSAP